MISDFSEFIYFILFSKVALSFETCTFGGCWAFWSASNSAGRTAPSGETLLLNGQVCSVFIIER
jgi:hypothetical protein